jgi:hypothetical protein
MPVVIEVKSIIDMIEASPNGVVMHKELKGKHYYYYYLFLGETLFVLMLHKSDSPYRRYVGYSKGKVLEASEPNSDCYMPIIEINFDPILELSLMVEENGEDDKKVP